MFKRKKTEDSSGALKKKALVCSTEAAAISIGIHVVLLILAGTWVAIEYVQKRGGDFKGENIKRPVLERRQLQMPVKVQNLQKKSSRPKVTSRMASVSQSSFSLPDMMGLGDIGGGFDRSGGGDRTLSSMGAAGSLGFGISGVNFFGARSKGEKMVFILDASPTMMLDERGGYYTYNFAKDKIRSMIDNMRSATLFNVLVYSDQTSGRYRGDDVAVFRPKLVPATPENRKALKDWIAPLNSDVKKAGDIANMQPYYNPPRVYDSVVGKDVKSFAKAVQAAMEMGADNIFILCSGWGDHGISNENAFKMSGKDPMTEAEWLESEGWTPERIAEADREHAQFQAEAERRIAEYNKERVKNGQPPIVLSYGARWRFITEDLNMKEPERRPRFNSGAILGRWGYDGGEIIDHLDAVYEFNYIPKKLKKPLIHVVKLIASDGSPVDEPGGTRETDQLNWLKRVPSSYRGNFELLRGAKTMEDLIKNNDLSDE